VTKHDARVPSLAEIRRAIDLADPDMATLIRTAIATRARRGELVALRWGDVDLDGGTLHVQLDREAPRTDLAGEGHEDRRSRNARDRHRHRRHAPRPAPTPPGAVGAARPQPAKRHRLDLVRSRRPRRSPVPDKVTHRWKRTAQAAGLDGVRLHDLRHAAATHMVAGRLRHASPAMTLDVYAYRDLNADRAAAKLLGGLLDG
jgi:integrase